MISTIPKKELELLIKNLHMIAESLLGEFQLTTIQD